MHKLFPLYSQNLYLIELLSVIADVGLILEDNWLCYYIDMLISL